MEDMNKDNTTGTVTEQQQGKTFTQEQVNAIVGKRLAEQKQQLESDLVKREQELNRREMGIRAQELLSAKGLSKDLADILKYDTEEELVKAIDTIEHLGSIKGEGQEQENGSPKGFRVLEHKLPSGDHGTPDLIADAFKRKDD